MYKIGSYEKTNLLKNALKHYGEYQHLYEVMSDELDAVEYQLQGVHGVNYSAQSSSTGYNEDGAIDHWYKLLDYQDNIKWVQHVYQLYLTWVNYAVENYVPAQYREKMWDYAKNFYKNPSSAKFPYNEDLIANVEKLMTEHDVAIFKNIQNQIEEINKKFLPDD